ncbi:superoxide dismutase family protein [Pricia sp. S334]|uniref:Superoxide dismutase family protein n=1 Tax=Pricia mediterranea TaxID=3076079 RepID=A0ABU3LAA9_9FLAO|nr:superoxide dismutase family protein [Pricia sp. S334]MDT7830236.1 superoxide dismutase family protein [Pricia sp. S334]
MKTIQLTLLGLLLIGSYSCKETKKDADAAGDTMEENMDAMADESDDMMGEKTLTVEMSPKSGSDVQGTVAFTQNNGEVTMSASFTGLAEGEHAIHIHENADCSADDGTSAGGHWNPTDEQHGKWGDAEGYHTGDIGNMTADADGNATIEFTTDEWCIGCDDDKKNIIGHSVIVHDGADDFTSQPSGAAGSRVSCGEITE